MGTTSTFRRREHAIRADLERLREAREFADGAAAEFGFDDEARYQLKLAMSEAVTNAIQHGSSLPGDPVTLEATEEAGALAFYVTDTGRFRPRIAPRGDLPERGRGLDFMRQLMDEVEIRPGDNGTTLRFAKRR
jgi:anti-sigma regulatory factor (Ser/Thr protein kinase)